MRTRVHDLLFHKAHHFSMNGLRLSRERIVVSHFAVCLFQRDSLFTIRAFCHATIL